MALIWERELGRERVQSLNQELEHLTQALEQKDIARAIPDKAMIENTTHDLRQLFGLGPERENVREMPQPIPDRNERPHPTDPHREPPVLPSRDEIAF